jgi:preprotein translocase subunit SecG
MIYGSYVFGILLFLTALFLILLVLVQRGKGGGLAGAFGGMGGQSAFGTKAGDTFTKITIGVAFAWIVLCLLSVRMLGTSESRLKLGGEDTQQNGVGAAPSGDEADSSGTSENGDGQSGTPASDSGSGGE